MDDGFEQHLHLTPVGGADSQGSSLIPLHHAGDALHGRAAAVAHPAPIIPKLLEHPPAGLEPPPRACFLGRPINGGMIDFTFMSQHAIVGRGRRLWGIVNPSYDSDAIRQRQMRGRTGTKPNGKRKKKPRYLERRNRHRNVIERFFRRIK